MAPEFDPKALLKRFEPVLKFTRGERFYPYDISAYVQRASLWVKTPDAPPKEIISEGALDLERLGELRLIGADDVYYLQFISPMNIRELAEYQLTRMRDSKREHNFRPSHSRLMRVGYLARLIDVIFSLFLLLRGRVPGDAMTAALATFDEMLESSRKFTYCGRVIHQSGWIVLQYWYFYPFNNWRTGFFGANDHEADWEMVNIYCYQSKSGQVIPEWVAYAQHHYSGDDLRRHWRDPEVEKVGEHPVVFIGGGSHASYYQPGEYLAQISFPFLRSIKKIRAGIEDFFSRIFRERPVRRPNNEVKDKVTVAFVDYAMGDGLQIGPGGDDDWADPILIEPEPGWVKNYRGLWGFYAQDSLTAEDAPAGPRYNRDGSVRLAWFDPLGWAGMEKIIPPDRVAEALEARKADIQETILVLQREIQEIQEIHIQRGLELAVFQDVPHLQGEVNRHQEKLAEERQALIAMRERLTVKKAALEALERFPPDAQAETPLNMRGHIRQAQQPYQHRKMRFPGLAEVWAAVSIGMMMIAVVLLILFARRFLFWGLGALLLVIVTIESGFRRRLSTLVRWTSVGLAVIGFAILLFEFFWAFALVLLMGVGFYMIVENLQELLARR